MSSKVTPNSNAESAQFTISASLKVNGSRVNYFRFIRALKKLMEEHGVTEDPHLTMTLVRINGERTMIAGGRQ